MSILLRDDFVIWNTHLFKINVGFVWKIIFYLERASVFDIQDKSYVVFLFIFFIFDVHRRRWKSGGFGMGMPVCVRLTFDNW